jgi:hypothetical protein
MLLVRRMLFLAMSAILALGTPLGMASQSAAQSDMAAMPCHMEAADEAPAMPECCGGADQAACVAHCAAMLLAQLPAGDAPVHVRLAAADVLAATARPFTSFAAPPGGQPPK